MNFLEYMIGAVVVSVLLYKNHCLERDLGQVRQAWKQEWQRQRSELRRQQEDV